MSSSYKYSNRSNNNSSPGGGATNNSYNNRNRNSYHGRTTMISTGVPSPKRTTASTEVSTTTASIGSPVGAANIAISSTTTTTTITTRLTVKPHPFVGAILSPKHAIELTPTLCLQIASALADLNMTSSSSSSLNHNSNMNRLSPLSASAATKRKQQQQQQQQQLPRGGVIVPYTVWITEAWRVLGWAEPSAALFWEMATMYYALLISQRESSQNMIYNNSSNSYVMGIPPILSCGSNGSVGSQGTAERTPTHSGNYSSNMFLHGNAASVENTTISNSNRKHSRLPNSVASAKELPVWLVSTFLLLHCEEFAIQRNLSGQQQQQLLIQQQEHLNRFGSNGSPSNSPKSNQKIQHATDGKMDFTTLFKYPSLSFRNRLHATWHNDHRHCTAYLLRHLRKILLLCAVSHSKEAQIACLHLSSIPTPHDAILTSLSATAMSTSNKNAMNKKYDADEIRRLHDDEHGNVGLQVRLTLEDLECLDFIVQPPHGGMIDEPCIRIGELMWSYLYDDPHPPPNATAQLGEVERELRHHLEIELSLDVGLDDSMNKAAADELKKRNRSNKKLLSSNNDDESTVDEAVVGTLGRLSLSDRKQKKAKGDLDETGNHYLKEMAYTRLRGTTVILKPSPPEPPSAAASVASGDATYVNNQGNGVAFGRLHDLVISDCSDAHLYLLQPFEHVTIAACSGCTIVVGAIAGLLHIVDCEKSFVTSAARRVLVSNCCDVQSCLFTPCPPLLVGDNRACQFAPYNTYYDGVRDDLLTVGLAAQSSNDYSTRSDTEYMYPLLQCASNKWKQPIELSKLEVPQIPGSAQAGLSPPLSPGADDRAMGSSITDTAMQAPVLVPPADYHVLFIPIESESSRLRRIEVESEEKYGGDAPGSNESQYCRLLAEVLQLSPFRLPAEYERSALLKAERMRNIQQAVQKNLSPEQQKRFEEELNRGFRDWLVSSGNLRQVLDLVHMENKDKNRP